MGDESKTNTAENRTKSLFEYDNYRDYLRDYYRSSKSKNQSFSFRVFARMAGFSSPGILKRVMDGERNLSLDGIEKFAKALKLKKEESQYFRYLVLLNQSSRSEDKIFYASKITKLKSFRKIFPLKDLQLKFYSRWYLSIVRELVCLPDFREDPSWIAKKLHPHISRQEAEEAIQNLIDMGLLERSRSGKLMQTDHHISTGDEVVSAFLIQYHKEILKRAADSIDSVAREKRDISSMALGISYKTAKELKALIQNFRKEVVEICSGDDLVETIYLLNFQLFPVVGESEATGEGQASS